MGKEGGPSIYKEAKWFLVAVGGLLTLLVTTDQVFGLATKLKEVIGNPYISGRLLNWVSIFVFFSFNIVLIQVIGDEMKGAYKDRWGFYGRLLLLFCVYLAFFRSSLILF